MAKQPTDSGRASPYATGGGGVTLEHNFGAFVLTSLLLGHPVPGLGDNVAVETVHFQASGTSPVDDLVVHGHDRRISFAVRRDPTIAPSDTKFVALLGKYLRVLIDHGADVDADRWRLGLVVAGPHTGANETAELSDFARRHSSDGSFRAEVLRDGATRSSVRARLQYIEEAVGKATASLDRADLTTPRLTWEFLRALYVMESQLEGDVAPHRTDVIARLIGVTRGPAEADALYQHLCGLVARTTIKGGVLDMATLRRELHGKVAIDRAACYGTAWSLLDARSADLVGRTAMALRDPRGGSPVPLRLERTELRRQLTAALRSAGSNPTCLIVSGEPDVGKSALTIIEAEQLRQGGESVLILSLRDMPSTPIELDHVLGAPLGRILGSAAVASVRLLVLDGAEVIQEGHADVVGYVLRCARGAGLGVVPVVRDDARDAITSAAARAEFPSQHFLVPPLVDDEVEQIARTFPSLGRVESEPRSRWLLGRPGLVEILLTSGAQSALPDGALSEADVFASIWGVFIRRAEVTKFGEATPDGREGALMAIIERRLGAPASLPPFDPLALASLRRDGVLLPSGPIAAWRRGDDFANDLFRDYAAARKLVLAQPAPLLADCGAPRWTVRAARLAAQARLAEARPDVESVRCSLLAEFDALASVHGERWRDVVWEALLTLGSARIALRAAAPRLLANEGAELAELLRVVLQRFCRAGCADSIVVAPVVELICDHHGQLQRLRRVGDAARDVVTAWLAGTALGRPDTESMPLRVRVRDELLARDRTLAKSRIEGLSLLGPDLDAVAADTLRAIGEEYPHLLGECVDDVFAVRVMALHRPDLLIELSDRYYIERPDPRDLSRGGGRLHDGVRRHHGGGLGETLASSDYGPFWPLLCSRSAPKALTFIKRLLDHATRVRLAGGLHDAAMVPLDRLPGIELDLPGLGRRRFIGDDQVWRWYRGTGAGPYPCTSALLAVERAVEQLMARPDADADRIATMLLRDCESLALPALVVGFLVRHLERAGTTLDPWLSHPTVWALEVDRVTTDQFRGLAARDRHADDVRESARRGWTFHHVASFLVYNAFAANNEGRLATLRAIGSALIETAATKSGGGHDGPARGDIAHEPRTSMGQHDPILIVRRSAAMLDVGNYRVATTEGGVMFEFVEPPEIHERIEPRRHDQARGQEAWRLLSYALSKDPLTSTENLVGDIALARELERAPPDAGPAEVRDAVTATAAAAIAAWAAGTIRLDADDRAWAVATVVRVASNPPAHFLDGRHAIAPWAADRLAARAAARLLSLSHEDLDDETYATVLRAVDLLASSSSDEVRHLVARALQPLWTSPCRIVSGRCAHAAVLASFRRAAKSARLGPVNPRSGTRRLVPLRRPERQLPRVAAYDVSMAALLAPIVAATDCAAARCCASADARPLRGALLDAHRRAMAFHDFDEDDGPDGDAALAVPRALFAIDDGELELHVAALVDKAHALGGLLHGLATVATADRASRVALRRTWPALMGTVLEHVAAGRDPRRADYGGARAFAALIPEPRPPRLADRANELVEAAKADWPTVQDLAPNIERWLPMASGEADSVDPLLGFLACQPLVEQVRPGIAWVSAIVAANYRAIANRSFLLPEWLQRVRSSGSLDEDSTCAYQRLVDGLAAAGDVRILKLQRALE